jgi:hypothetical protein
MEEFRLVHRRKFKTEDPTPSGWKQYFDTPVWYGERLPANKDWDEANATSALIHVEEDSFMSEVVEEERRVVLQSRKIAAKLGNLALPLSKWRDDMSD